MSGIGTQARPPAVPAGPAAARRAAARALLAACRPKQWLKNLLVFAAPVAAGLGGDPASMARAAAAFLVLCLAASGTYLLNDARDVRADRLHPRKARRPVAAGRVSVRAAVLAGAALVVLALAASVPAGGAGFAATVGSYLLLATSYSLWLKHRLIVDLVAVAGCHLIRAVAGAVVAGVPPSSWFLIVVSLMSLLVVVGKREAELGLDAPEGTRAVLSAYSPGYLGQLRSTLSGAVLVTYALWALELDAAPGLTFRAASIVPFTLVVMRLNLLMERGAAEEPEELAVRDRSLQLFLVLNVGCVVAGLHL